MSLFSKPKAPPPVPRKDDAEVQAEMERHRMLAAKAKGRSATIVSNPEDRRPIAGNLRFTTLLGGA